MKAIYLLQRRGAPRGDAKTEFLQADPHNVSDGLDCPCCGRPVGMFRWAQPLRAELETWDLQYGDLAFGPGESILVAERFKDLWLRSGLVGLSGFEPVDVVKVVRRGKRIKEAPPPYFRVLPQRSAVAVDEAACGWQWEEPPSPRCDVCRGGGIAKGWQRIVLEAEPHENLFIPRGLGWVLVDEHFKRFCEAHAITNCPLIPAEQASHWF